MQTIAGLDDAGNLTGRQAKSGIIKLITKKTTTDSTQIAALFSRGGVIRVFECECFKSFTISQPLANLLQALSGFFTACFITEGGHDMRYTAVCIATAVFPLGTQVFLTYLDLLGHLLAVHNDIFKANLLRAAIVLSVLIVVSFDFLFAGTYRLVQRLAIENVVAEAADLAL